jgi:hypothetical protein
MYKVRIVNKAQDTVTLDFHSKGMKVLTWEEFNEKYLIKSKIWAVINPEWIAKKKAERAKREEIKAARKAKKNFKKSSQRAPQEGKPGYKMKSGGINLGDHPEFSKLKDLKLEK